MPNIGQEGKDAKCGLNIGLEMPISAQPTDRRYVPSEISELERAIGGRLQ